MARKSFVHKSWARKSSRQVRGGGYSVTPSSMISPGNVVYSQYTGEGKDCVGAAAPSMLSRFTSIFGGRRSRRSRGGYVPQVATVPLSVEIGTPAHATATTASVAQKGGRYGFDPSSNIGMGSYAPIHRIPCEHSRHMSGGSQGADMLEVRAPTAGYAPRFESFPGTSAVGGLMTHAAYDARAPNPACHGGKRRTKKQKKHQKKSRKQRK